MFRHRKFTVAIYVAVFITAGISFWYFGHHHPAQKSLKAEPKKVYKATTPMTPKTQTVEERSTETTTHADEAETFVTPLVPDTENTDAPSSPEQSGLPENAGRSGDTPVSEGEAAAEHKHTASKEEQEASKKLLAEAEKALENAKQIRKEGLEMMREAMPIVANHLNTLSTEEQIKTLRQLKTTMSSQVSLYPPEFRALIEESDVVEEGWRMYLDMLAEAGYTPPRGFE